VEGLVFSSFFFFLHSNVLLYYYEKIFITLLENVKKNHAPVPVVSL
jgi:hypothetical protein